MLDQQPETQREAVRKSCSRSSGDREHLLLDPEHGIQRKRESHPLSPPLREPRLATPFRLWIVQTTPQYQDQPRHETPTSRMVCLASLRSPLQSNDVVGAGPGSIPAYTSLIRRGRKCSVLFLGFRAHARRAAVRFGFQIPHPSLQVHRHHPILTHAVLLPAIQQRRARQPQILAHARRRVTVQQNLNRFRLELRHVLTTRSMRLLLTLQDSLFSHRMPFLVESRISTQSLHQLSSIPSTHATKRLSGCYTPITAFEAASGYRSLTRTNSLTLLALRQKIASLPFQFPGGEG